MGTGEAVADAGTKKDASTPRVIDAAADARGSSGAGARDASKGQVTTDAAGGQDTTDSGKGQVTADASAAQSASDASAGSPGQASLDASTTNGAWASGGTKSMQGNYPDPFTASALGMACALYPAQTLGPCYAAPVSEREDISDGLTGLPVRMSFLVVREDGCTPVSGAEVDVWHAGSNGIYSAFASGICNPDRLDVANQKYCRGKRNTDASGRVDFSTVFPGWYTGRTIHIHFTVRVAGREYITSQLYFDDSLNDEIMRQVDYEARGARDTTNRTDSILRGANVEPFLFATAKRPDGALHAWKVLSVRS